MPIISRRYFSFGSGAVLAGVGLPALAQAPVASRRIAFLSSGTPASSDHLLYSHFIATLKPLGWAEGTNLTIDRRYSEGDPARAAGLSSDLLALKPDIFVSSTDIYARPAAQATKTLPIVFVLGFDPVGFGLVQSLARPGGNVTGFSVLNYELNGKRLALFKEALPSLRSVGVLYRENDAKAQTLLESMQRSGRGIAVEIVPVPIRGRDDFAPTIGKAAQSGLGGVMNVPDPIFFQERKLIADLCLQHRVAASFGAAEFADAGMLLGFGTDFSAMYRRAAALVDRLLRGAVPATIPVEQANSYELVVNLKTAQALGIKVSKSVLLQATRMIE